MSRPYTHTHTLQHVTLTALQAGIPERILRDLRKLKQLPPKKVARWRQQYQKDTTPAYTRIRPLFPSTFFQPLTIRRASASDSLGCSSVSTYRVEQTP